MTNKTVQGIHGYGSKHWVGDGFPVRNIFPSNGVNNEVSPFLMLDYLGPAYFPPSETPHGVGEHPHRGFETVTIVYEGVLAHRDSTGSSGILNPGDVQWMTAASGIVHEEMHEGEFARRGGTMHGVQLWVNLPKVHKMSKPGYQSILNQDIPVLDVSDGVSARVIAGILPGATGPAKTFTPMNVFDVKMKAGSRAEFELPEGHNGGVVLLHGGASVDGNSLKGEAMIAVLSRKGTGISLSAETDSSLLILTGEPINEPVAQYGPFVMNTQDELRQAVEDYRSGKMGHLS
ncbi:MAG: pirin family protein [Acidobacteria bacterium]|nr:pirin family protein [Acidobacteriota bacterium]